jgi:F0F1-type ATP synthase membrane subunit b/b'
MQDETDKVRAKADFEATKSELTDTFQQGKRNATDALHDARDELSRKAGEYASEAKDALVDQAEAKQQDISASLTAFGGALRAASEHLANSDQRTASKFVLDAAGGLERLSSSIKDKPFEEVLGEIRSFGRDNSGALIAGSVLAGLALGRFIKSSEPTGSPAGSSQYNGRNERTGENVSQDNAASADEFGASRDASDRSRSDDPNDGWVSPSMEQIP